MNARCLIPLLFLFLGALFLSPGLWAQNTQPQFRELYSDENTYWQAVREHDTRNVYRFFLKEFPQSQYAQEAKERIAYWDKLFKLFPYTQQVTLREVPLPVSVELQQDPQVYNIASSDLSLIVNVSAGDVLLFQFPSAQLLEYFQKPYLNTQELYTVSRDNRYFLFTETAAEDVVTLHTYSLNQGQRIYQVPLGPGALPVAATLSHGGRWIGLVMPGDKVYVVEGPERKIVSTASVPNAARVAFSFANRYLLVEEAGEAGIQHVFDWELNQFIQAPKLFDERALTELERSASKVRWPSFLHWTALSGIEVRAGQTISYFERELPLVVNTQNKRLLKNVAMSSPDLLFLEPAEPLNDPIFVKRGILNGNREDHQLQALSPAYYLPLKGSYYYKGKKRILILPKRAVHLELASVKPPPEASKPKLTKEQLLFAFSSSIQQAPQQYKDSVNSNYERQHHTMDFLVTLQSQLERGSFEVTVEVEATVMMEWQSELLGKLRSGSSEEVYHRTVKVRVKNPKKPITESVHLGEFYKEAEHRFAGGKRSFRKKLSGVTATIVDVKTL